MKDDASYDATNVKCEKKRNGDANEHPIIPFDSDIKIEIHVHHYFALLTPTIDIIVCAS